MTIVKDCTAKIAEAIIQSRRSMVRGRTPGKKRSLEGGCGVIGIIGSEKLKGHCIIRPCEQMRNRGNGKGGGAGRYPDTGIRPGRSSGNAEPGVVRHNPWPDCFCDIDPDGRAEDRPDNKPFHQCAGICKAFGGSDLGRFQWATKSVKNGHRNNGPSWQFEEDP